MPHRPQEAGTPLHESLLLDPAIEEAKEENFFSIFEDPQRGHLVPFQLLERNRISLSCWHFSQ